MLKKEEICQMCHWASGCSGCCRECKGCNSSQSCGLKDPQERSLARLKIFRRLQTEGVKFPVRKSKRKVKKVLLGITGRATDKIPKPGRKNRGFEIRDKDGIVRFKWKPSC